MIGLAEVLIVMVIALLIFRSTRRTGPSSREQHPRVATGGTKWAKTLLVVGIVAAATGVVAKLVANWMGVVGGGMVAGAVGGAVAGAIVMLIVTRTSKNR